MISNVTRGARDMEQPARFYRAIAVPSQLQECPFKEDGGQHMLCFRVAGVDPPRLYVTPR